MTRPREHEARRHVFHAAVEIDAAHRRLARVLIRLHRPQLAEGVAKQRHRDRQLVRLAALESRLVTERVVDRAERLRSGRR